MSSRGFETDIEKIESALGAVVGWANDYPHRHIVPPHRHRRSQLLYTLAGVPIVSIGAMRWLVPPDHALWIPAGLVHSIQMTSQVSARSIYVDPQRLSSPRSYSHVVRVTQLMRSLVLEATERPTGPEDARGHLIQALILDEIPRLAELPLGLRMPDDPRFATLCQRFLAQPSAREPIDRWAAELAMSRRTFTRAFRRETGMSLLAWRQQASLCAALPRLARGEPVTSVAMDVGYESVAAFTTMFRRMLGAPPRRYMGAAG